MISMLAITLWLTLMQARDGQPAGAEPRGTCEIRGRITDQASGLPIARAVVRLQATAGGDERTVRTDEQGRYQFTGLAAGEYDGLVEAGEFRATHVPTTLSSAGGTAWSRKIVLKKGEIRHDIDIALRRALAMSVRVVNEWGEPLAGVGVSASSESGNDFSRSRGLRPTGPPCTLARGGPVGPRSARVAHSLTLVR
jgi:hypothetical protein